MAQCTARNKGTDVRCKGQAVAGSDKCRMHGAGGGRARENAKQRAALEEAGRMVQRAGVDQDPLEHLLDSLHQAAQLAAVWGLMVDGLDQAAEIEAAANETLRGELGYVEVTDDDGNTDELRVMSREKLLALNSQGMAAVHPFVLQFEKAIDRRGRLAKMCVDAGVEQKLVALAERRAELVADVFRAVFDDPELGLPAEKRRAATVVAARHLRLIAGGAA